MQEIAIILSSLAGVATAAAVRRAPRNKTKVLNIGASSHIKSQINSLKIEKDILTKTISRLYQADSDYSKIQRDKLLIKYQHQLGIILAKLEKLEESSKHPDLGPVGDGLITLMDQKLSNLDDRLYELSSKISSAKITVPEIKQEKFSKVEKSQENTTLDEDTKNNNKFRTKFNFQKPSNSKEESEIIPSTKIGKSFEITTLTNFSNREPKFPSFTKNVSPKEIVQEVSKPKEQIQTKIEDVKIQKTELSLDQKPDFAKEVEKITKFKALPEPPKEKQNDSTNLEDDFEDDSDDIDKIKGEIMNVLSKLDQAEVE